MTAISRRRWDREGMERHCFMYCGDDRCTCRKNPNHPDNPSRILRTGERQ